VGLRDYPTLGHRVLAIGNKRDIGLRMVTFFTPVRIFEPIEALVTATPFQRDCIEQALADAEVEITIRIASGKVEKPL